MWAVNDLYLVLGIKYIMRKIAERLRELRTERSLSMLQLGERVGISSSSISRWENNQSDIMSDQLIVLAKFFGVSVDDLLGLQD